jgi:hypothetical protein
LRDVLLLPGFGASHAAKQFMEGLLEHVRKSQYL